MSSIFQGLVEKTQGLVHFDVGVGDVSVSYADFDGVSGSYISEPDSVDNSIRQAIIIEVDIAADNYSAFQAIITKSVDGQNPSYRLMLSASAQIVLTLYDTADTNDNATSISLVGTVNNGERIKFRALYNPLLSVDNTTFEVDTGNGWEFFSLGNNSMREIRDSANPVEVGSLNNGTGAVFAGKIYSARIYKGVTTEPYAYIDGAAGTFLSTPDTVENSIRGAIVVDIDLALTDYTNLTQTIIAKSAAADIAFRCEILNAGNLQAVWSEDGTAILNPVSTVAVPMANGERGIVRYQFDPTAQLTTFFISLNGGATFTQLGDTIATAFGSLFDSTEVIAIGSLAQTGQPTAGIIYDAKIYKGIPNSPSDAYIRLDGVLSLNESYVDTPSTPENSITGSMTVEFDGALDDWSNLIQVLVAKYVSTGAQRSWRLEVSAGGAIVWLTSVDGGATLVGTQSTIASGFANGTRHTVKIIYDAVAQTVTFYTDGAQLGTVLPHVTAGIFASTAPISIGARDAGANSELLGFVYGATVAGGDFGSVKMDMDPYSYKQGDATFTSDGSVFTLQGNALAVSSIDDGLKLQMDPYPALQGGGTFPLDAAAQALAIFPGAGGDYFSTPDTPLNSITGDIDLRWTGSFGVLGLQQTLISKETFSTTRAYRLFISAGNNITLNLSVDGTAAVAASKAALIPFVTNQVYDIRVTWSSIDQAIVLYVDGVNQGGNPLVIASIFDSNSEVAIGAARQGALDPLQGTCLSAQVYRGIYSGAEQNTLGPNIWPTPVPTIEAGWSYLGNGAYSYDGSAGTKLRVNMPDPLIAGRKYRVSMDITEYTAGTVSLPYQGSGADYKGGVGSYFGEFTASLAFLLITSNAGNPFLGVIDNIRTQEISPELAVNFEPDNLQGWTAEGNAYIDGVWTVLGNAIATSPIDDGLKVDFNPANVDDGGLIAPDWTVHGGVTTLATVAFRHMYWNPLEEFVAAVYASVGEPVASVGAGGLSFDAGSRLRIAYGGGPDKINLPGGMAATPDGSLIVGGPPDVIHQGVGLTNECYVADFALAGLLGDAVGWFDETSIVGTNPVTAWNSKGDAAFSLDTVIGTAGNMTRMANGWGRLPGEVGDTFSTPDSALNSIIGDLDVRWEGSADDWSIAIQELIAKAVTPTNISWELQLRVGATLRFVTSVDGTASVIASSTAALPFANGEAGGIRVTFSVGDQEVIFYTKPIGGEYTQLGAVVPHVQTAIFDGTADITIGSRSNGGSLNMTGYMHSAQVYDGIYNGGPLNEPISQLVVNGTFDVNADAWVPTAGTSIIATGGEAQVTNEDDGGGRQASQSFSVTSGRRYRLTAEGRKGTGTSAVFRVTGAGNDYTDTITATEMTEFTPLEFIAAGATTFIALRVVGMGTGYFDNVSCQEISAQLAVNFDPTQAIDPQVAWADNLTAAVWTPEADTFVNTTGKDVVHVAGDVSIETALNQVLTIPFTFMYAAKLTSLTGVNQVWHDSKSGPRGMGSINSGGQHLMFQTLSFSIAGATTDPRVMTEQFNGDATSKLTVSDLGNVVGDAGNDTVNFETVFSNINNVETTSAWMGELIVFDRALTPTEISTLQDYLANKWT